MIAYEAAPGATVTVLGSRLVPDEVWDRSLDPGQNGEGAFSSKLWMVPFESSPLPADGGPFNTPQASDEEIEVMPWAHRWRDRIPYRLGRGLVFQDGRRLEQLSTYEDLARVPGSFWVDREAGRLHLRPFGDVDPVRATFEVTVHDQLFKPTTAGTSYLRIAGLTFAHAANGFPRIGVGAIDAHGGHHWIVEDCTVRDCNSVGIEVGARTVERANADDAERDRVADHPGGFTVRDNHVFRCGTGGIQGHTVHDSVVERNHLHDIGWQDVERYFECAGIKLLRTRDVLVRHNLIHDVESAAGIWLDWDNRHSRVTGNVVADVRHTILGGIFLEASRNPNLIDRNVVWGVDGRAVNLSDTSNATVVHNLFGPAATAVSAHTVTDRSLDDEPLASTGNEIRHNLLVAATGAPDLAEGNEYTDNATVSAELDRERWELRIRDAAALPELPGLDRPTTDYYDRPWRPAVVPGPFNDVAATARRYRLVSWSDQDRGPTSS